MTSSTDKKIKKVQRKADEGLKLDNRRGQHMHHRMKPYLVYDYLLRYTDEDHLCSASDISGYLEEFKIFADRRSIYDDIKEINKILYALDNEATMEETNAEFDKAESEGWLSDLQTIVYDKSRKGFYVQHRRFDLNDIRLLTECVYSARFLSQGQSDRLADAITEFVSEYQKNNFIRDNTTLTDRIRTPNKAVMRSISTINEAMRKSTKDSPHIKHKISFKYLKYNINDVNKQAERRPGKKYIVSPFKLLINDGNYYLLAFSDQYQEMRTYRLDRMSDVEELNEPRDGEDEFLAIDMDTFTRRTFGMFSGESKRITLRFINRLLDTVVDRFGTKGVIYRKADDDHFDIDTEVDISDQFFGWLLGFGNKVKIMGPDSVITAFTEYLDKVRNMY